MRHECQRNIYFFSLVCFCTFFSLTLLHFLCMHILLPDALCPVPEPGHVPGGGHAARHGTQHRPPTGPVFHSHLRYHLSFTPTSGTTLSFIPTSGTTSLSLPPQVPPVFHSHLRNYLSLTPLLCTSSLYILINS